MLSYHMHIKAIIANVTAWDNFTPFHLKIVLRNIYILEYLKVDNIKYDIKLA